MKRFLTLLLLVSPLPTWASPSEIVWFVTTTDPGSMRGVKQTLVDDFVGAESGSVLHVVACVPGAEGSEVRHKTLGTLLVGDGSTKARLRDRRNRGAWSTIGRELTALTRSGTDQINICAVGATIASLRRLEDGELLVRLVGSPLFRSDLHSGFNFVESRVPSDGSLNAVGVCPFATNIVPWGDAKVTWLATGDWMADHIHSRSVARFYSLFLSRNCGADLRRLTDRAEGLLRIDPPQFRRFREFEDDGVRMRSWKNGSRGTSAGPDEVTEVGTDTATVSEVQTEQAEPPSVASLADDLLDEAEQNPDSIAVRMDWISDDPHADIDFHVRTTGERGELSWAQMQLPFGELYRDVRAANGTQGELDPEDLERVEAVRLDHNRLWHVELYLHTWQARAPVEVRLVVVWNGIRKETLVTMPAVESNTIESPRTLANGWRRIPLMRRAPKDWRTASVSQTANL